MQISSKYFTYLHTPIGLLRIHANKSSILCIEFDPEIYPTNTNKVLHQAKKQLCEYFEKKRKSFDLPLNPLGTPFQNQAWEAIKQVAYGKTSSYKNIAISINNPKSVRAIGRANALNPIPIIIPCHRIVGSQGDLVGYAGGLDRKRWLLQLENPNPQLMLFDDKHFYK